MKLTVYNFVPVVRGQNKLEIRNEASSDAAELILVGAIGKSWWDDSGITEKEVRDALKSVPSGRKINARINSEGGSVQEGLGIYNAFKERRADITAHITGYALSIASVFPLGAGRVVSPKSAIWMMHKAWSWNQGNADDMRQAAEMLDAHDETLVDIYAAETGKSKEEIRRAMESETWVKGADAVNWGLADETDAEEETAAAAAYRPLDQKFLDRCKNLSPAILNALRPAEPGMTSRVELAALQKTLSAAQTGGQHNTQTTGNNMKKTIVALLIAAGIEASESETDAQLQTKLEQLQASKLQKDSSAGNLEEMKALRQEMAAFRRTQMENRLNTYVDTQRCTKAEAKIFLATALLGAEQEKEVFAALDERAPAGSNGGDHAGVFIEMAEASAPVTNQNGVQGSKIIPELDNIFTAHKEPAGANAEQKALVAAARYQAMKAEWPRLLKAAFRKDNGQVMAANTFSATVTTNFLIAGAIQKLSGRFAAANLFARDAEQDPFKPLAAGIRKFNTTATDGTQVQSNPTDFEALGAGGDSTIDAITITPTQQVSGGHLTNAQLQSGFRVADIIEKKLIDLAAKVTQVLTAPITVANFTTNAALVSAPAAFSFSDLATLQGQLKKTLVKNLILDGEYLARISNTPGFFQPAGNVGTSTGSGSGAWRAFGWDNIALNTDWSGAGANVRGFACGQDAIGFISGLPLTPPEGIPGNIANVGTVMLPDVNIGIQTWAWWSNITRTYHFTFDLIIGATLVDELQGVLVKSA